MSSWRKYNTDGSLDTSFGTAGIANVPSIQSIDPADLAIGPSGQVAVGGSFTVSSNSTSTRADGLGLFDAGGLDVGFGTAGLVTATSPSLTDITAVAFETSGQIVVGGSTGFFDSGNDQFALARYNTDGTLDGTFGAGGIVTTSASGNTEGGAFLTNIEIEANGSILAIGGVEPQLLFSSPGHRLYKHCGHFKSRRHVNQYGQQLGNCNRGRLRCQRQLEHQLRHRRHRRAPGGVVAGAQLADGDIVIVGTSFPTPPPTESTSLVAFNSSGDLDTSFDGTGSESINLGSITESNPASATCEAIQSDGKIIAVGTAERRQTRPPS